MSIAAKRLFDAQFAPTSAAILYSAPTSTNTIVDKLTATNVTGSAVTLTLYLVPSGGSAASSNMIISALSIAGNTCVDLTQLQNQILNAGDSISALSNTGSALVVRGSGREVS